jgi:3-phenylpropionate/trans-cinnamate dioxygenase ferredoxin reductase subunit
MPERVVIVGAGQGGVQAAASLRSEGWQGEIVLIGDEPGLPYQRPPLSKDYLSGKMQARQTELRAAVFFEKHRIELRSAARVDAIDRDAGEVVLSSGERVGFDFLILATGARNRQLKVDGSDREHVVYLRTLGESTVLRAKLEDAKKVAVVGGGFIGLEVAAAARALGKPVTVIEALPRLMARVVSPDLSEYFRATHADHGVEMLFEAAAMCVTHQHVETTKGAVDADLVVVGIGVIPNLELAESAGLPVKNGIVVDNLLRTVDARIFAIGDCAAFPSPYCEGLVRLESVQNCVDQAVSVAKTITGKPAPYTAVPWFWTDQFDIRMQMAGLAPTWDQLVSRGDPATRKFSVFYFLNGVMKAANSINRPADHLAVRKLLSLDARLTPEQAADENFDLKIAMQP